MHLPNVQIVRTFGILTGTFAKKKYLAGTKSTCGGLGLSELSYKYVLKQSFSKSIYQYQIPFKEEVGGSGQACSLVTQCCIYCQCVIVCHQMSLDVILFHSMSSNIIYCHLMTSLSHLMTPLNRLVSITNILKVGGYCWFQTCCLLYE